MSEPGPAGVERFDLRSGDPEFAHAVLRRTYDVDFAVRLTGSTEDFRFELAGAAVPEMGIGRTRYSMTAEMDAPPPTDHFLAATPVGGQVRLADGREEITPEHGTPVLMPLDRGYSSWLSDVDVHTVSLSASVMDRAVRSVLEADTAGHRFTSMVPVSAEAARYWGSVVEHVRDTVLADDEVLANPLVLGEATRSLAIATLVSFPNTALARWRDRPETQGWTSGAVLRRALAFIDEHAGEDIGVDDIAAAARIGVRGLQYLFRRHRDCTPLEHLRRVRIAHAHVDLQAADPTLGDSVAAIAARWGFTNPGRFAVQYRQTYGHSPRDTLRR